VTFGMQIGHAVLATICVAMSLSQLLFHEALSPGYLAGLALVVSGSALSCVMAEHSAQMHDAIVAGQ